MDDIERLRGLLQVILDTEADIQRAYLLSGARDGAWVDGNARDDVRTEISTAAKGVRESFGPPAPDRAKEVMETARRKARKAIRYAEAHGFEEQLEVLRDLPQLGYRAVAVDAWRDLRRSVRIALDTATERAGVPHVPPAGITFRRAAPKVGRNAPCPCGSGKKHKRCCGR